MTTNDDLDDFFKKKDRKSHKHKKPTGLLSNNEELLKQLGSFSFNLSLSIISLLPLVIVTSATSAFKENPEIDDDDDEQLPSTTTDDKTIVGTGAEQARPSKSKTIDETSNRTSNGQSKNVFDDAMGNAGQDEWEEFDSANNSKYEQIRLKFAARNDNDDYDDDDDDERLNRNDENHEDNHDREQNKDKPVWNIHQANETVPVAVAAAAPIVEEPASKPAASTGAYRPPQLRTGGSAVTVVSGGQQKSSKKREPNFASTDEFPTLKSTVNKK